MRVRSGALLACWLCAPGLWAQAGWRLGVFAGVAPTRTLWTSEQVFPASTFPSFLSAPDTVTLRRLTGTGLVVGGNVSRRIVSGLRLTLEGSYVTWSLPTDCQEVSAPNSGACRGLSDAARPYANSTLTLAAGAAAEASIGGFRPYVRAAGGRLWHRVSTVAVYWDVPTAPVIADPAQHRFEPLVVLGFGVAHRLPGERRLLIEVRDLATQLERPTGQAVKGIPPTTRGFVHTLAISCGMDVGLTASAGIGP